MQTTLTDQERALIIVKLSLSSLSMFLMLTGKTLLNRKINIIEIVCSSAATVLYNLFTVFHWDFDTQLLIMLTTQGIPSVVEILLITQRILKRGYVIRI
ncbi:hypothetical protein MIR68_007162 [Amoeboaphelidium protococcarum]|nr:hypothetical protein MIR68_007162 [Amoeboaphelidium protococcarum]